MTAGAPRLGGKPAGLGLDGIKLGDTPDRFGGDRRSGGLLDLVEFASRMSPAMGEHDTAVAAFGDEPVVGLIGVDLEDAVEAVQLLDKPVG